MLNEDFEEKLKSAIDAKHNISACIRVQWQNKFLLLKRSTTDFGLGIYEIPGGSVDKLEGLKCAAVRELFEETGISVLSEKIEPLGIFDFPDTETGKHKTKFAFSVKLEADPKIILSPDHDDFMFLSKTEIDNLPREGRDKEYVLWDDHYRMLLL